MALIMLALAIMNAQVPEKEELPPPKGLQLMMAIDVSKSMLATDVSPNRLERARNLSLKLLENLQQVKVGLIAFAGNAVLQMPPTTDVSALKQVIQTLNVESVPNQGTQIEEVLQLAYNSLSSDAASKKAVWIVTDGEELQGEARKMAEGLAKKGLVIFAAGVGTQEGITLKDEVTGTPLLDDSEEPVVSKMNPELLMDLANISNGVYLPLSDIKTSAREWEKQIQKLEKINLPNDDLRNFKSLSPIFLSLSLFFLLLPTLLMLLGNQKRRNYAMVFLAFVLIGFTSKAQSRQDFLQQAKDLYKTGNYKAALEKFSVANTGNPSDEMTVYFLGLTQFRLGNYQESAKWFTGLQEKTADPAIKASAAFNAGIALANANKLDEAIEIFKTLQVKNPSDEEITRNLQKALMEQKKKEPPRQESENKKPPMNEQDAAQKLQSVIEEERKVREQMKPKPNNKANEKNW